MVTNAAHQITCASTCPLAFVTTSNSAQHTKANQRTTVIIHGEGLNPNELAISRFMSNFLLRLRDVELQASALC